MDGLLHGKYEAAKEDTQHVWKFIWEELLPKVIPAHGKAENNLFNPSYPDPVDAGMLMNHAEVSDEAIVLTILSVKEDILETIEDDNESTLSNLTEDSDKSDDESGNQTASSKRKRNPSNGESMLTGDFPGKMFAYYSK